MFLRQYGSCRADGNTTGDRTCGRRSVCPASVSVFVRGNGDLFQYAGTADHGLSHKGKEKEKRKRHGLMG